MLDAIIKVPFEEVMTLQCANYENGRFGSKQILRKQRYTTFVLVSMFG